jgi:hypothetical protein
MRAAQENPNPSERLGRDTLASKINGVVRASPQAELGHTTLESKTNATTFSHPRERSEEQFCIALQDCLSFSIALLHPLPF